MGDFHAVLQKDLSCKWTEADMKIEEAGGKSTTLSILMMLDVGLQAAANSGA
jgi:hypothetical protein